MFHVCKGTSFISFYKMIGQECGAFSHRRSRLPEQEYHYFPTRIFLTLVTVAALQKYLIVKGLRVTTKRQR